MKRYVLIDYSWDDVKNILIANTPNYGTRLGPSTVEVLADEEAGECVDIDEELVLFRVKTPVALEEKST